MNGEKKIFWVKIGITFVSGIIFLFGILYDQYFCFSKYYDSCFLTQYRLAILYPLFVTAMAIFITSASSFFIPNKIFKKWILSLLVCLMVDIICMINYPVQSHYDFKIGPTTKHAVSIWMGFFFVFVSLAMFIVSKMENPST